MCYHWSRELQKKKNWNCSKTDAPYNRECAIKLIKDGMMQGYLAYCDGSVVGWCNANDKQAFDNVNFALPCEASEKDKKIKSVVCFCIAPAYRGKGVASALLKKVCEDAKDNGYEYIEAYPFNHDENNAYHGPTSMYKTNGFTLHNHVNGCTIYRKYLK
ncbi:MAG TPA: GNAT family N-acetyltransferase [Oscillospiraceae bacterium]|nr:GNAT family N-acetyltransferase [Oscillospiraceae bacterium]HPS35995.1 GNAT family N-acetyltransferase [Oscillospiraceae bacterium]